MPAERECPLCGETMHLKQVERTEHIPGTGEVKKLVAREWICPECEYFEDAEESA